MPDIQLEMLTPEIGQITINQDKKRNALSAQMWDDLGATIAQAASNQSLKVLIVTGAGVHFSAGADIREFGTLYATSESSANISAKISGATNALANFPKPTIAKIRGVCVGGGCGLALACDIRFADKTAKFAITPSKLGLVYPFSDIQRLIQAVGLSGAKDILFSARLIDAEEARSMGLIDHLVEPQALDAIVANHADSICETSTESNQIIKQMFLAYESGQRVETDETEAMFLGGFSSEDFQEGYKAFLENRKPSFSG